MTAINTNIGAIQAQSNMGRVSEEYNQAMTRLSSGKRINAAKDDAAGMAIGEKMTAQIKGLNQAVRNATDAKSLVDTTEGAHIEVSNMLQRMRELSVQSANDTNTAADRNNINAEAQQLISEVNRVAETTTFNGMNILDGSFTGKQFQIGADSGQTLNVDVDSAAATDIGAYTQTSVTAVNNAADTAMGANNFDVTGFAGTATINVTAGMSAQDAARSVNEQAAETGVEATAVTKASLSGLTVAENVSFTVNGVSIGEVAISDTGDLTGLRDAINTVAGQTGVSATMGSGTSEIILTDQTGDDILLDNFDTTTTGTQLTATALQADGTTTGSSAATVTLDEGGDTQAAFGGQLELTSTKAFTVAQTSNANDGTSFFAQAAESSDLESVAEIDLTTAQGATDAIKVLDVALQKVSQSRSDLGAVSNRLDSTISNLTNISTNVEAARSGIMDADFAKESTDLARGQILQQAATSMLAQANSAQQNVLSLIR